SSASDPIVTFSSPGWKTISLTATNATGSTTASRTNYILISDNSSAPYGPGYYETFDNASTFTNDWIVMNPEGNTSSWKRVTNAGYQSSSCAQLNNYANMDGDVDDLITPAFDLSAGGTMYLDFRYTCANHTTTAD